jgi:hypothetical protein
MSEEERKTYLLSHPRSGNTWVRYCVEFISGKPTAKNIKSEKTQIIGAKLPHMNVDLNEKSILNKVHSLPEKKFKKEDQKDRLIFLLRNPFEVLNRRANYKNSLDIRLGRYIFNLKCFDMWNGDKILIYYEDLILNPRENIGKIVKFMGLDINKLNTFMKRYEYHKGMSIKYYCENVEGSFTKGKENLLLKHSSIASKSNLNFIRTTLNSKYKSLADKYLNRYM